MPDRVLTALTPERVSPAVLALVAENAPNRRIICAGGGSFEQANITLTGGIHLGTEVSAEELLAQFDRVADRSDEMIPSDAMTQGEVELAKAGISLR